MLKPLRTTGLYKDSPSIFISKTEFDASEHYAFAPTIDVVNAPELVARSTESISLGGQHGFADTSRLLFTRPIGDMDTYRCFNQVPSESASAIALAASAKH